MKNQMNTLSREKKIKTPWYYYVIGALTLSAIEVFMKEALNVSFGWIARSLMMIFFVFFLPRTLAAKRKINR